MTDADIVALHAQRLPRKAVAERLGVSPHAVRRACERLGLERLPSRRKPGRVQTEAVMVRFSPEEVAAVDVARGERPRAEWVREVAVTQARKGEEGT